MHQKTIDEIAGLILYMDDLIINDQDNNPYVYIDGVKVPFRKEYDNPISAINKFKGFIKVMEEEDCWKDGKHSGDCTKVPATCFRCLVEEYRSRASKLIEYFEKE
jgi:hypothetical protein